MALKPRVRLAATRALMVLFVLSVASCSSPTRRPRAVPDNTASFTLMTFNVNYGLAGDPVTLGLIETTEADVVFLQETTPRWERSIRESVSTKFPHMEFRHSGGAGGLGVLSKLPFRVHDYMQAPSGWFPSMRVVVQSSLGPVQVLQVHLHPPVSERGSFASGYMTTGPVRAEELASFIKSLDPALPALVVGDFNENYRGQAAKILYDRGMHSVLREYDPYQKTWRWKTSVGALRQTLDHVFYNPQLEPVNAAVAEEGRSDHFPIVATFVGAKAIN